MPPPLSLLLSQAETHANSLVATLTRQFNHLTEGFSPAQRQIALFSTAGVATLTLGGLALSISNLFRKFDKRPKRVLITGAGSGLGRAATMTLLKNGDYVIGADIDVAGLEKLEKEYPNRFITLAMNVGDVTSVKEAAARIKKFAPNSPRCLDAIVNFAGILRGGGWNLLVFKHSCTFARRERHTDNNRAFFRPPGRDAGFQPQSVATGERDGDLFGEQVLFPAPRPIRPSIPREDHQRGERTEVCRRRFPYTRFDERPD